MQGNVLEQTGKLCFPLSLCVVVCGRLAWKIYQLTSFLSSPLVKVLKTSVKMHKYYHDEVIHSDIR